MRPRRTLREELDVGDVVVLVAQLARLQAVALDDAEAARIAGRGLAEEYARDYDDLAGTELSSREASDFAPPRGVLLLVTDGDETVASGGIVRGVVEGGGPDAKPGLRRRHDALRRARRLASAIRST